MKKKLIIAIDVPRCNPNRHFNGVMRYLSDLLISLSKLNFDVKVISPDLFKGFYIPRIPEVRISFCSQKKIKDIIEQFNPDFVHIEYEGPVGRAIKKYCLKKDIPFSTCFHSRYDLHVKSRFGVPLFLTKPLMLKFHKKSGCIMTRTPTMASFLKEAGLHQAAALKPTVNSDIFFCMDSNKQRNIENPCLVYSGRIAPEKNLDVFLSLSRYKNKMVIGDGPYKKRLEKKYPDVRFTGYLSPSDLNLQLNKADVFVMPSRTETLGRNMLEAIACGLSVAAFPENGPQDIIKNGENGWLSENLQESIEQCLFISKDSVVHSASEYINTNIATQFIKNLTLIK